MTYLDQAFQKVAEKPCVDCVFYIAHDPGEPGLARCGHPSALTPITKESLFALEMRNNETLCGLKGKLWQTR